GRIAALAAETGRDPETIHRAAYMTLVIDEDESLADKQMRTFMETYYGVPYETLARASGLCAGNIQRCVDFVNGFIAAGVQTIVIRFGSPDQSLQLDRWRNQVLPHVKSA